MTVLLQPLVALRIFWLRQSTFGQMIRPKANHSRPRSQLHSSLIRDLFQPLLGLSTGTSVPSYHHNEPILSLSDEQIKSIIAMLSAKLIDSQFTLSVDKSVIVPMAGKGVHISSGAVKKGAVVALYPGYYYPPPPTWAVDDVGMRVASLSRASTILRSCFKDSEPAVSVRDLPSAAHTGLSTCKPPEDSYQFCVSTGGFIDGYNFDVHEANRLSDHRHDEGGKAQSTFISTFSVGQYINHPPRGIQPNVVPIDFHWRQVITKYFANASAEGSQNGCTIIGTSMMGGHDLQLDSALDMELFLLKRAEELNPIAGGSWFVDPKTEQVVNHSVGCSPLVGLALVSTRDIKAGEEVFLDYRFDQSGPVALPDWYSAVTEY